MKVPKVLGRYHLREEIGRGNMGVVFLADDPFHQRAVAIKITHPRMNSDGQLSERHVKLFYNEASATSFVKHPNIVQIYDASVQDGMFYLVMEYVKNSKTLANYTNPKHLLPVHSVIEIIYKLAKALDFAHRQGVTHRDIKPSNVLLTENNDVKLADYGIALINRTDYSQTQVDGVIGTPSYMSPEQISNDLVTSASDVFSLGILMYQLLTGVNPFQGGSFQEIYKRINYIHPRELGEFRKDFPPGVAPVLKRMLQKSTDKRYKTALDVAADLSLVVDALEGVQGESGLQERFDVARSVKFFEDFSDTEIWEFLRSFDWKVFQKGETIITQGEVDNSLYVLVSGVVSVVKDSVAIKRIQAGDCFGEMGYISGAHRTASVVAHTDVGLIRMNARLLERAAIECQNRFLKVFVRTLSSRLSETSSVLASRI